MKSFLQKHKYKILALTVSPAILTYSTTYYLFPDLRNNQYQLLKALNRTCRVVYAGARMAYIYQKNDDIPIEKKHEKASLILRDTFIKNAGLYLKFAQLLSSLDVIVPQEYRNNFETLCHDCPQSSFESVKKTIESQLDKPLHEIFSYFNEKPLKSASIAQVHEAILKENGQKVAVKVQHDWLSQSSKGDIKLVQMYVNIGEKFFPEFKFKWFSDEIEQILKQELNFYQEIDNGEKARELLKNKKNLYIPQYYFDYCSEKVITMEYIDGFPIMDVNLLRKQNFDLQKIAFIISDAFSQMIFNNGFVHSDPHQGNLLIRKVSNNFKSEDQVVLLDHGLYKQLTPTFRLAYSKLWKAIIEQDISQMEKSSQELGVQEEYSKLFVSMITSRVFDDITDKKKDVKERLISPKTQQERDKIVTNAAKHHKNIIKVLQEMNRYFFNIKKQYQLIQKQKNIDHQYFY
ncbi:hypothetical protein IMG5_137550 [Ichthyophthirius multifiliis]|uniref:Protein kinase domain-containing protein n=1 Tax=Ichthyophthirius multifiliis TaxID=5932 RepID=G0QX34_ICHMU|nr:hypothetical protein IMG5_137550 [Ichthyophthirius multifiliis]EGR30211.1 hypothetical protein IMG5_137550 [Ichthyophthirius multifiliis]|eukprot:XP_004031807.1 hypothetical protein IMG5_137550 [Ichthyophthirius multifiliis]